MNKKSQPFEFSSIFSKYGDGQIIACGYRLPHEEENEAIRWNQKIEKLEKLLYPLDSNNSIPYIRVYEAVIPNKNIETLISKTSKVISKLMQVIMLWGSVEESEDVAIIWGEKNELFEDQRIKITETIDSFREGYVKQKYVKNKNKYNEDEQWSIEKWGWPWAGHYEPYLVLGQAKQNIVVGDFDIVWPFNKSVLSTLFLGIKSAPGTFSKLFDFKLKKQPEQ